MSKPEIETNKVSEAVRKIAPEKADKVLTRYQKVQEGLHDVLFGEDAGDKISAAEAGLKRLEEMENELLAKGSAVEKTGVHKEQREALVTDFDAELAAIADGLGLDLSNEPKEAEVRRVFEQEIQKGILEPLGINVKVEYLVKAYMKRSGDSKSSLETILASFSALEAFGKLAKEPLAKENDLEEDISLALIFFVNGHEELATAIVDGVAKEFEMQAEADEVVERLQEEREKLKPLEDAHLKAAEEFLAISKLNQSHVSEAHAAIMEKYATSLKDLVDVFAPLVKINESFVGKEPAFAEERAAILAEGAGDVLNVAFYAVVQSEKDGPLVVVGQKMVVPATAEEFAEMQEAAAYALLFVRRELFLKTRLPKYKPFFDESQEKMTAKLNHDAKEALDEAAKVDEKDISGEMLAEGKLADYRRLKTDVDSYAAAIVQEFDKIQRLQITDPIQAAKKLIDFKTKISSDAAILEGLDQFFEKSGDGSAVVEKVNAQKEIFDPQRIFFEVGKYPALRATLLAIFDNYMEQADIMAVDIVAGDPDLLKFQDDFREFYDNHGKLFGESINTLINQIEEAQKASASASSDFQKYVLNSEDSNEEAPSEALVEGWIHSGAIETMMASSQVLYEKVDKFLTKIEGNYHYFEGQFSRTPLGKEAGYEILGVINKFRQAKEYLQDMNKMCASMLEMKGPNEVLEGLKILAKLFVAVVAAVVALALVKTTAGTMAPLAAFILTTAVGSFGGAVGFGAAQGVIEGDWSTFKGVNFLKAWGTGALFCGAGRILGNVFGVVGGRTAAALSKISPRLSMAAQRYMERYAARLLQASAQGGGATGVRGLVRSIIGESGEEVLQESIQYAAYAVAQISPESGFVLSCIPSARGKGRAVFVHETGGFAPAKGITGFVADNGMIMEYEDAATMKTFLEERGAPQAVKNMFAETGVVSGEFNGVAIHIKPTTEPGNMREKFIGERGLHIRQKAGLRFDKKSGSYTYSAVGKTMAELTSHLEESGFVVETDSDGRIKATGPGGKEVMMNFVDPVAAEMMDFGLSLDGENRPTVETKEAAITVLGKLMQLNRGYKIEEGPSGFVVEVDFGRKFEIRMDRKMADEMVDELRLDLQYAEAVKQEAGIEDASDISAAAKVLALGRSSFGALADFMSLVQSSKLVVTMERVFGVLALSAGNAMAEDIVPPDMVPEAAKGWFEQHGGWPMSFLVLYGAFTFWGTIKGVFNIGKGTAGGIGRWVMGKRNVGEEYAPWDNIEDIEGDGNLELKHKLMSIKDREGIESVYDDMRYVFNSFNFKASAKTKGGGIVHGEREFKHALEVIYIEFRLKELDAIKNPSDEERAEMEKLRKRHHELRFGSPRGKNPASMPLKSGEKPDLGKGQNEIYAQGLLGQDLIFIASLRMNVFEYGLGHFWKGGELQDRVANMVEQDMRSKGIEDEAEIEKGKKAMRKIIGLIRKYGPDDWAGKYRKIRQLKRVLDWRKPYFDKAQQVLNELSSFQFDKKLRLIKQYEGQSAAALRKEGTSEAIIDEIEEARSAITDNYKDYQRFLDARNEVIGYHRLKAELERAKNIEQNWLGRGIRTALPPNPVTRGAVVNVIAGLLSYYFLFRDKEKENKPVAVAPPPEPGTPEAKSSESAGEGGKDASSTDAGLKASQDATEMANKKIELKQVVDMLKSDKNELGEAMSPADKARLEKALRDLELRLIELHVPQKDIDKIKGTPAPSRSGDAAVEKSGTLDTAVQPDTSEEPPPEETPAEPAEEEPPAGSETEDSKPPLIFN